LTRTAISAFQSSNDVYSKRRDEHTDLGKATESGSGAAPEMIHGQRGEDKGICDEDGCGQKGYGKGCAAIAEKELAPPN